MIFPVKKAMFLSAVRFCHLSRFDSYNLREPCLQSRIEATAIVQFPCIKLAERQGLSPGCQRFLFNSFSKARKGEVGSGGGRSVRTRVGRNGESHTGTGEPLRQRWQIEMRQTVRRRFCQ